MTPEEKIDKLKKLIRRIVNNDNKMEGQYSMPYSTNNDDYADWKVELEVNTVKLWETEKYNRCKYSGSLYLDADVMVGFEGDWEKFNIFDSNKIGVRTKYPTDGFYFDIKKKYAKDYGKYIYSCFLNIRTPLQADFDGGYFKGYKYDINDLVKFVIEGNYNWYGNKYDGVEANNIIDTPTNRNTTSTTYVALKSNQIKLADGTNKTFDKKNTDIRFEKGGEIKKDNVGWTIFGTIALIVTLGKVNAFKK
jgi:hypothetical protein